jgi:hypothetical protein
MAKIIKYKFLSCEVNHGTEENPNIEQIFFVKSMPWSEANEEFAKCEAYNGEYAIEDDGQPEPVVEPTADDILNAMLGVM